MVNSFGNRTIHLECFLVVSSLCWLQTLLYVLPVEGSFVPIGNLKHNKFHNFEDVVVVVSSKFIRPQKRFISICLQENDNKNNSNFKEDSNENEKQKTNKPDASSNNKKKLSRLAMAAADWLEEEEEEDELTKYWGNYEMRKNNEKKDEENRLEIPTNTNDYKGAGRTEKTTQELLDDYYEKLGIDKKNERQHEDEIKDALRIARMISSTTQERINALEQVKPFLQPNTRLGGQSLIELATLYCNNNNVDTYSNDARQILMAVQNTNQDQSMRRRARQLLLDLEKSSTNSNNGSRFISLGFNFDSFWS